MLPANVTPPAPAEPLPTVAFGPFAFDRHAQILRRDGTEIPLPPRVLAVLGLLVARAGHIVSRQELTDAVWKDAFVTDTSLAEAVSFLRQALGDDPQAPTYVQTVHRRGYRFVAPLDVPRAAPPPESRTPATHEDVYPTVAGHLIPWCLAVLSILLAVGAVRAYLRVRPQPLPVVRIPVETTPGTFFDTRAPALAVSPSGDRVAWAACAGAECRLYVRALDRLEPGMVAGSEDASAPFFSPDGRWVGFFAAGKLKKVAVAGGSPIALTDAPQTFGAAWLPDGRIVFAASGFGGLFAVSDRGGEATAWTTPNVEAGEVRHAWPSLAAGGRAILFTIATSPLPGAPARVALVPADAAGDRRSWRTVIDDADLARPLGRDFLVFSRGQELHAIAFDSARLETSGVDQLVLTGIGTLQFGLSETGALVHAAAEPELPAAIAGLSAASGAPPLEMLTVSPDARHLAGVGGDQSASDIWVTDVNRGTAARLTHGGSNVAPVWTASGTSVVFASARGGAFELWSRDAAAGAPERKLLGVAGRHLFPTSTSGDGRLIAFVESGGPTRGDIWTLPAAGGSASAVVRTPFDEINGMLSPDGQLLAYQSDESGRWQIYVMNLTTGRRTAVSTTGGTRPMWEGTSLSFVSGPDLVTVTVDGATLEAGAAQRRPLDGREPFGIGSGTVYARSGGRAPAHRAVLTLEWLRELRQKVAPAATLPR